MTTLTVELPDELAKRIQPAKQWLPTILALSVGGFVTPSVQTATEAIQFLMTNPSAQEVLAYKASERAHVRMRKLRSLNENGVISHDELAEFDEAIAIERILRQAKIKAAAITK